MSVRVSHPRPRRPRGLSLKERRAVWRFALLYHAAKSWEKDSWIALCRHKNFLTERLLDAVLVVEGVVSELDVNRQRRFLETKN